MLTDLIQNIVLPLLAISFLLVFIRLIIGPSLPDRVIALDMMSVIIIAFICCYSVIYGNFILIDIATVIALIGFLGTTGFAYYFGRKITDA